MSLSRFPVQGLAEELPSTTVNKPKSVPGIALYIICALAARLYQGSSEENFLRVVNFNYDKNKDIYQMFSDVTNDNTMNRDVRNKLNDMLPDFFLMPQRGIRLKINRLKNGNYTILNDRLPVFLCMPVAN